VTAKFQLVIDCADPVRMSRFWAAALGYEVAPPPKGFATWKDYWEDVGFAEAEIGPSPDRVVDPSGNGPPIWFRQDDLPKSVKNRLHIDIGAGGGRSVPFAERRARVEAEAARLTALGATRLEEMFSEGVDHYAVAMLDPEGNEFDIN
jgi:Glyoxalase-like domain